MTAPQPGRACPVDLDYPEPQPASLDLSSIIGHGRRIRRRRMLSSIGAVLAACLAAASVIAGARDFSIRPFPGQASPPAAPSAGPIDAQVAEDPPFNGKLTLISSLPEHWTTVAWVTRQGDVCLGTFSTPAQSGTARVQCPEWDPSELPRSGSSALSSIVPDGTLWAAPHGNGSSLPVIGLTSPQAVRVVLTALGEAVSATVVPVPAGPGKTVGVFLAWIRLPGDAYNSTDITSEAAYDRSGHLIAHARRQS